MFSIIIRTNRQSSKDGFYFLQIIFLLNVCTAFITIANALNNNENEAIIQLSIDSIHVVKSSDPRFSNIEDNANDDEEKELLMALLTSFDDDNKYTKQMQIEKSSKIKNYDDLSISNNCSSTSSIVPTTAFSSIRFVPPLLDFGEQSIAMPRMQTVTIINDDSQPLELHSLSGTTVQFYSSFFTQKTLLSNGGNTTINVYYLPRTLGITKSTFTIKTNRGNINYYVNGFGTSNPFHLRPLIGATMPLNSTFEHLVHFYNPYNYSIDIHEIYTSDENLIIELLSYKSHINKIKSTFQHKEQWHIKPFQMKPIMKINYFAYKLDRLHGFYCIKTNSNDTIIVPVEINVFNHLNLYSNVDILEFSPGGIIRSTARPITIPVYVINNGIHPVTINDVRVTTANRNHAKVHYEKVQVPSGINHLTKIAELTIDPRLVPNNVQRIRGSVQIYSLSSIDNEKPILQIPFRATVLHGSLDYEKETTFFYIPSPSTHSSYRNTNECQPIRLTNRFNQSMVIYNITADKSDLLSKYIKMNFFSPYTYVNPGQSISPLCVSVLQRSSSSLPFTILEATLTLHTNLSFFHLPIYLYSGLLYINVVTDSTNGGIKRNDTNSLEYFIASISVNTLRTVKYMIINPNPIDISIESIALTIPQSMIRLTQMQLLNGSETKVTLRNSFTNENIIELVIPSGHQAIFSLTINGTNDLSFYNETITYKTRYETLVMNVKYRITSESIELENELPLHIDVFPNRVGTIPIVLNNRFDEPIEVTRMEFPTYGKSFSFIWNNTSPGKLIMQPNQTYVIGELSFDMIPLCNSIKKPSESTCYCGLNNHPKFKQRWEQHVSALNTYELDHILVTKFRNLWKEWTSLVRKQRIQTNIWLVTDQANVSWPITIGFVWPSVLELMTSALSRTPVILDFHLTLISTTKTQNIIITNPSSSTLQYSVALVDSYEDNKNKMKRNSNNNDQIFDITPTSKRVELSNGVYKFSLQPNEYMIFTASYQPKFSMKNEMYLVVRNNLTIIESILLRGEGGSGILAIGNRKADSSDIPLVLEMNEKQYELCSNGDSHENRILDKLVTFRNTGNMKTIIHDISFGHSKCSGQGFSVTVCSNIEIEPNERYDLHIRFEPDYTLAEITDTLTLNTNIGLMTFPIIVRIPQRILATCYQTLPRPIWELRVHWFCVSVIVIMLIFVIAVALYDAQRLLNDFAARAELQRRLSIPHVKFIDLADSSTPVQNEPKTPERVDLPALTNPIPTRKETSKEENKVKDNEIKTKRSNISLNGTKDNVETSSKTSKVSNGSNPNTRSVAMSPKAISQKVRRATTDNGQPKPMKQQTEIQTKPSPLRAQKSLNSDQSSTASLPPLSPTPPSTVANDDGNEPFVPARTKRVSGKTKESTTNTIPTKSSSITDGIVPLQATLSVPSSAPPVSTSSTPKSSGQSQNSEQSKQKLSRSNDSLDDQQWHMVSSNRGQRKGSVTIPNRRETTDESQTTKKTTTKGTSNNTDFSRYASQTEQFIEEASELNKWTQQPPIISMNDIPSIIPTNLSQKTTIPPATIKENVEPLPFPQHGLGPIQRPNKLTCPNTQRTATPINVFSTNLIQSPGTPDVLDQINRLLDHEIGTTTSVTSTPNVNNSTVTLNDLTTPNIPWTPLTSGEWTPKYDSSWPLTTIQSPSIQLTTPVQNPFSLMSALNDQQRQRTGEESSVWSSVLDTAATRLVSSSTRTQRASTWNDLFSSTVPSSTETTKTTNNTWLKFWPAPDPPSANETSQNVQEQETTNSFWNLNALSNPSVVSSSTLNHQQTSTTWWPNSTSDENNNTNQTNHLNDDTTNNRDQSRWDFAR